MPKYKTNQKIRNLLYLIFATLILAGTCLISLGLYVRGEATKAGQMWSSIPNETGSCYLNTYVRKYSSMGALGRIARLFGSEFYYRIYSKQGELLKTSEWTLWETELGAEQSAYWIHGSAMFLTTDGLKDWDLQDCNK